MEPGLRQPLTFNTVAPQGGEGKVGCGGLPGSFSPLSPFKREGRDIISAPFSPFGGEGEDEGVPLTLTLPSLLYHLPFSPSGGEGQDEGEGKALSPRR